MADNKTQSQTQPDDTVLGGDAGVPDTAGSAAGGTSDDEDATKPPEK